MKYLIQIGLVILLFCTYASAQDYELIIQVADEEPIPKTKLLNNFNGDSLEIYEHLEQIIEKLHNNGYLASSFDRLNFDEDTVTAELYLGQKYYWSELDFSTLPSEVFSAIGYNKMNFESVNIEATNNLKLELLNYYENHGYPFAQVRLKNIEIGDSIIKAAMDVIKGPFYVVDSLIIKGDVKITHNYMEKLLQLKSGSAFNQGKINEFPKKIDDSKFLSEIKPAEVEFKKDEVDLYLYLDKRRANLFNGIIGFLPESPNNQNSNSGKLQITGELNLNLLNSFGRGEEILLKWEKMESTTQKLDVAFMYPYLFKSNLGFHTEFSLYKKDSTYLSMNAGLGLRLYLKPGHYVGAYYKYKSSLQIGDSEFQNSSTNLADIQSSIFGANYYINELDYTFNPRKGFEVSSNAGVGVKNISDEKSISDSLNLDTDNKTIELEIGLEINYYIPVYKNFVFHLGNTTRYLDQFGDNKKDVVFYENELYRFGGAQSLRGFDESIFLASVYSLQNAEIKYLFERNSSFYLFWNGAYYYKDVLQETTEDFPWGFGIGMDFQTKAGIFSLSYALGKQFDNPIELRSGKIHFGYISRF